MRASTVAGATLAVAASAIALRHRQLRWGATPTEVTGPLPGDDLLPDPDVTATRAITIRAAPGSVWPWVAQLGQGRGGFYSYDWLENLAGCEVHSADRIVPEWQHVAIGDDVRLHPDIALEVLRVDPPRALVVGGGVSATGGPSRDEPAPPYDFTWAFVLVPESATTTRLVVRERYTGHGTAARVLVEVVSLASFVMTERMLRGIRDRAEASPSA